MSLWRVEVNSVGLPYVAGLIVALKLLHVPLKDNQHFVVLCIEFVIMAIGCTSGNGRKLTVAEPQLRV